MRFWTSGPSRSQFASPATKRMKRSNAVARRNVVIPDVTEHQTVAAYVREVKRRLEAGDHDATADRAARRLKLPVQGHDAALLFANELPDDDLGPETEPERKERFVSRHPLVSPV